MPEPLNAHIHHYFPHPETGHVDYDDDGDPIIGFYYQIVDLDGEPLSEMMGPYSNAEEAEEACHREWKSGDFLL